MTTLGQEWVVVGGSDKGGVLVRLGQDLSSPKLEARLATGSRVEQVELINTRLHYRRLSGEGPESGWVTITLNSKDLLVRALRNDELTHEDADGVLASRVIDESSGLAAPIFQSPAPRRPPRAPSPGRAWRILCIGDSLTSGGYPRYLQDYFGKGVLVKDFGVKGTGVIPGETPAYRRLPRLAPELQHKSPDAVVVMLGTNDAKMGSWHPDTFVAEYLKLLRQLQGDAAPGRLVLVGVPPQASRGNSWGVSAELLETAVPDAVRRATSMLNVPTFDARSSVTTAHLEDGVHLSPGGSAVLAGVIHLALMREIRAAGWEGGVHASLA